MKTIDRRSDLSEKEFLEEYARPGIPVIIEKEPEILDWPALQLWSEEFFRENYGDVPVDIYLTRVPSCCRQTTLREFLDNLHKPGHPWYLKHWTYRSSCPELQEHYRVPRYFKEDWVERLSPDDRPDWKWIYIGATGSGSELHVDLVNTSAWNVVLAGKKKWVFYHPDDEPYLYRGRFNAFEPDFTKYPLAEKASPYYGETGPGDLLFTPSLWWHQTENIDCCIAVTENFVNSTNIEHVISALEPIFGDDTERIQAQLGRTKP